MSLREQGFKQEFICLDIKGEDENYCYDDIMLDVGKNIPPDLYEIIAKVYCSILSTAEKFKKTVPEKK